MQAWQVSWQLAEAHQIEEKTKRLTTEITEPTERKRDGTLKQYWRCERERF
jgi:hypothetical protein